MLKYILFIVLLFVGFSIQAQPLLLDEDDPGVCFTVDPYDDNGSLDDGSDDAFDDYGFLYIDGDEFDTDTDEFNPPNATLGPETYSGLEVTREIYAYVGPNCESITRYLDCFTNNSASPITVEIRIEGDLGSDSNTEIEATSSGDLFGSSTDFWVSSSEDGENWDDGDNDPPLAFNLHGPGSSLPLVDMFFEDEDDEPVFTFAPLTIAPGETSCIMHFVTQAQTISDAIAIAMALNTPDAAALSGVDVSKVKNYAFGIEFSAVSTCINSTNNTDAAPDQVFVAVELTEIAGSDITVSAGGISGSITAGQIAITLGPIDYTGGLIEVAAAYSGSLLTSSSVFIQGLVCGLTSNSGVLHGPGLICEDQGEVIAPALLNQFAPRQVSTTTPLSIDYYYVAVNSADNSIIGVNQTGLFNNLPGLASYTVYGFNVDIMESTTFAAALAALGNGSLAPAISGTGSFSGLCYESAPYIYELTPPAIEVVPFLTVDCFESINPNPDWASVTTPYSFSVSVSDPVPVLGDGSNCEGDQYTVEYTVTADCAGIASATQTYTIQNDGPTMDCPDNCEVFGCYDGQAQAVIDAWINTVTATSSCSDELVVGNTYHDNGSELNGTCIWNGITPVTFYANDDCGRPVSCESLIIIIDDDAPVIIQQPQDLLIPCTANTDEIYEDWLDDHGGAAAVDACGGPVSWTYSASQALNCEGGPQVIEVDFVATDNCGNSVTVSATFNTKLLPLAVNVAGLIQTEAASAVSSVQVAAYQSSGMMEMDVSDDAGDYSFEELPYEENTEIVPNRDGDYLNGVSTYDLIELQQHILGVEDLDSPYKRIAADANRSGSISTLDLVLLRRLILHLDEELADNTSWRFVDADYIFPNPENPFETDFPEIYVLSGEEEDWANFVAVKIGDLNLDAETNSFGTSEDRSGLAVLEVQAEDQQLQAGQIYEVELSAANFTAINGFQFTLDFDRTAIEILDIKSADLADFDAQHYGLAKVDAGAVTISWNTNTAQSLNPEEAIFSVVLRAQSDVQLSEALSITSAYTKAEAYQSGTLMNVNLNFSNNGTTAAAQQLRLYQNQPNPFKDATMIGFDLPKAGAVDFMIYDVTGKLVYRTQGDFAAGYNQIELDRSNLPGGGVFYYHVQTDEDSASKKMIFMD